tara:strand:+ start:106 stop:282 length:177 start_codon:yes stop_codon:yes gene_type:complete
VTLGHFAPRLSDPKKLTLGRENQNGKYHQIKKIVSYFEQYSVIRWINQAGINGTGSPR